MKYFILFILPVCILFSCAKKSTAGSSRSHTTRTSSSRPVSISTLNMNSDIINVVNGYRQSHGLPPMHLLALAASEAARHSSNMASKKVPFGHAGFNQRALAIANDLNGTSATGENVAFGRMTARQVLDAWLRSPDHKANIEGNFNYTGVGVAKDSRGVVYYTQIFVKK